MGKFEAGGIISVRHKKTGVVIKGERLVAKPFEPGDKRLQLKLCKRYVVDTTGGFMDGYWELLEYTPPQPDWTDDESVIAVVRPVLLDGSPSHRVADYAWWRTPEDKWRTTAGSRSTTAELVRDGCVPFARKP